MSSRLFYYSLSKINYIVNIFKIVLIESFFAKTKAAILYFFAVVRSKSFAFHFLKKKMRKNKNLKILFYAQLLLFNFKRF
jgi:hypothetical protein